MIIKRASIRSMRPESPGDMCLKHDGVNDIPEAANSSSFNFANADFTFSARFFSLEPWNSFQNLVSKGDLVNTNTNSVSIQVHQDRARFVSLFDRSGGSNLLVLDSPSGSIKACEWYDVLALRKGGDAAGNVITGNYELWLREGSGIFYKPALTITGSLLSANIDSTGPLQLAGANTRRMYRSFAGIWGRALNSTEISGIEQGVYPASDVKAIYEYDQKAGQTLADTSSSRTDAILNGWTATELGVPDPATNRSFIHTDGVFGFRSDKTAHTFTASKNLTIYQIGVSGSFSSLSYIHKGASGNVITGSTSPVFDATGLWVNTIVMLQGEKLEWSAVLTSAAAPSAVELFYDFN